jgi:hypothetical protein
MQIARLKRRPAEAGDRFNCGTITPNSGNVFALSATPLLGTADGIPAQKRITMKSSDNDRRLDAAT